MKCSVSMLSCVCVLIITVISAVSSLDCDRGTSDGCSIPFKLPYFFKDEWVEDCHKHDQCYFCGGEYNFSREDCDKRFLNNLKFHCDAIKNDPGKKQFCNAVRTSYYLAVRAGGGLAFRLKKRDWCQEDWVKQCI